MSEKIKIEVTQEDIDGGCTHICTLDPITQAVRRALGLVAATFATATRFDAFTQPSRMFAKGPKGQIQCETPHGVRKRILAWDEGKGMEPFDFELALVANKQPDYAFVFPGVRPL
jgi:hypothetical protein